MQELKDLEQEVLDAEEVFEVDLADLVNATENLRKSSARVLHERSKLKVFIADKNNLAKDIN